MSSVPSPGWPPPPAGPGVSLKWRVLHSWWLLLPVLGFSCLGGFGFIYVGLRARRPAWWIPGIVYTVLGWTAFILVGEAEQGSATNNWSVGLVLAVWMGSILHAALINSSWLRWRAGYRPWYAQPAAAWRGGPYPPGTLAPPPGAPPAHPVVPVAGPTSPAHPPAPGTSFGPHDAYYGAGPVAAVPQPGQAAVPQPAPPVSEQPPGRPIDVNTAGADELAALPGFDPHRAGHVLAERGRRGGFGSLAEFAAAANLAPHEYARLRDLLVCAPPPGPPPGQPRHGRVLDV